MAFTDWVSWRIEDLSDEKLTALAERCVRREHFREPGKYLPRYRSYLAGRAAIALLLRNRGIKAHVVPHAVHGYLELRNDNGSPFHNLFVNVSHSAQRVVAVLSQSPIGVDTELHTRDASKVIQRVASPVELDRTPAILEIERQAVRGDLGLWCAKEAVSKALGLGIVFGMQAFEIDLTGPSPYHVVLKQEGPLPLSNAKVVMALRDNHLIAFCGEAESLSNSHLTELTLPALNHQ